MTDQIWKTEFTSSFIRSIDKLPEKIAIAIIEFATAVLPTNPERMSKPLGNELDGERGAVRGAYRIIFWLDEDTKTIHFVRAAHRSDVYYPNQ